MTEPWAYLQTLTDEQLHTALFLDRQDVLDFYEQGMLIWGWEEATSTLHEKWVNPSELGLIYAEERALHDRDLYLYILGRKRLTAESFYRWENPPPRETLLAYARHRGYVGLFLSSHNEEIKTWDEGIHLCINVNDIFAPAADADAEAVSWEDLPELIQLYQDQGSWELVEWVAKRRGCEPYAWHPERHREYLAKRGGQ